MKKLSSKQKVLLSLIFIIFFYMSFSYVMTKRNKAAIANSIQWIESYEGTYELYPLPAWYVSSPKFLQDLLDNFYYSEIISINLSRTGISIIHTLKEFSELKELNMNGTKINSLDFVKENDQLENLFLNSTFISDLSPIQNLKNLKKLDISYTKVSDFKLIPNFQKLEVLSIRGLTVKELDFIYQLPELKVLEVSYDFDREAVEQINIKHPKCKVLVSP